MYEISFTPAFIKALKKKIKYNPNLEHRLAEKLNIFKFDPFSPQLKTHKLTGVLAGMYSFSLEYDIRVIFTFYSKSKIILLDIGKHDEVY